MAVLRLLLIALLLIGAGRPACAHAAEDAPAMAASAMTAMPHPHRREPATADCCQPGLCCALEAAAPRIAARIAVRPSLAVPPPARPRDGPRAALEPPPPRLG